MIWFNFKIAWRTIWKSRVFSSINILGLALSMTSCLIISLYVWSELSYDSFHKNLDDIYRITQRQNQAGTLYTVAVSPGPLAPALQKDFPEILNTVRFGNWGGILTCGNRSFEQAMLLTENSLFSVFDFTLLKGNPRTALLSPDEIVISEDVARQYFGKNWQTDQNLLGRVFRLNNETDFKLAGILKNVPQNSSIQFNILLPINYLFKTDKWSYQWNSNTYHTYLQLKPGTNQNNLAKKIERQYHTYNAGTKDILQLQPLKKQYLYSKFDFKTDWGKRSDIKYSTIFTSVGLLLLLIACVNFVNLSTARSLKRLVEVGIRKVNGASRKQLVVQFLTESLLITCIAGIASVFMIYAVRPFLKSMLGDVTVINFSVPLVTCFFLGFVLIIGLLAGLYPAFALSMFKPAGMLKNTTTPHSDKLFQKSMVVFQFVISIALISSTFIMYRQLRFMQQKDLGFDQSQLISVRLGGQLKGKAALFKQELSKQTSITATAPATMALVNVENSSYIEWEGMQDDDKFLITQANVDPDFIRTLGIKLLTGANFSYQKSNDTVNYILNEAAVKRLGYTPASAIGKQLTFWGAKGNVIGVAKDFNFKSLNTGIEPFILRYQPQDLYFNVFVKTAPGKTRQAIKHIQKAYQRFERDTPLQYSFVDEEIDKLYRDDRRTAMIMFIFACLTIFVGCLGLFGLVVFAAQRRTKEIGIRKVLGASVTQLTTLLSKDFLRLVVIAILIASPIAWYAMHRWLQDFAYRIEIEWWMFAIAGLLAVLIALLTVSFQAIKAAMANPVESLRTE